MFVPGIKDCSECYLSRAIEVPKDFPKLVADESKIMHLSKVHGVFSQEQGSIVLEAIRASKKFGMDDEYENGKRKFYISPNIDSFKVQFKNGKVQQDLIADRKFTSQDPSIQMIMIFAMQRLAKELHWENTTHNLACNAIDYHFTKDSKEPLKWHNDGFERQADYSFITLLSDPEDKDSGWTGGDLLYTTSRVDSYSKLEYKERLKILKLLPPTNGEILNEPNSPIWKISHSHNDGILFGNKGMRHKVTAMAPLHEKGRRMILTVFDFGVSDGDALQSSEF